MARKKRQYLQQEQTQEPVSAMLPSSTEWPYLQSFSRLTP